MSLLKIKSKTLTPLWFTALFFIQCASKPHKDFKPEHTSTDRARMLVEIANGSLNTGDAIGALEQLARAEEEDPKLPELYHSKAIAYSLKHDFSKAISEVSHAIELKPNYSEANNTLGKLLIDLGRLDEAIKPLYLAANDALYRDAYKAWTALGILSYRKKNYRQSQSYLNRAIQNAMHRACIAFYYRGHINLRKKKMKDAILDYTRATEKFCAGFEDASLALGIAYQVDYQFDLARKTFIEIQKRNPESLIAKKAMQKMRELP